MKQMQYEEAEKLVLSSSTPWQLISITDDENDTCIVTVCMFDKLIHPQVEVNEKNERRILIVGIAINKKSQNARKQKFLANVMKMDATRTNNLTSRTRGNYLTNDNFSEGQFFMEYPSLHDRRMSYPSRRGDHLNIEGKTILFLHPGQRDWFMRSIKYEREEWTKKGRQRSRKKPQNVRRESFSVAPTPVVVSRSVTSAAPSVMASDRENVQTLAKAVVGAVPAKVKTKESEGKKTTGKGANGFLFFVHSSLLPMKEYETLGVKVRHIGTKVSLNEMNSCVKYHRIRGIRSLRTFLVQSEVVGKGKNQKRSKPKALDHLLVLPHFRILLCAHQYELYETHMKRKSDALDMKQICFSCAAGWVQRSGQTRSGLYLTQEGPILTGKRSAILQHKRQGCLRKQSIISASSDPARTHLSQNNDPRHVSLSTPIPSISTPVSRSTVAHLPANAAHARSPANNSNPIVSRPVSMNKAVAINTTVISQPRPVVAKAILMPVAAVPIATRRIVKKRRLN